MNVCVCGGGGGGVGGGGLEDTKQNITSEHQPAAIQYVFEPFAKLLGNTNTNTHTHTHTHTLYLVLAHRIIAMIANSMR